MQMKIGKGNGPRILLVINVIILVNARNKCIKQADFTGLIGRFGNRDLVLVMLPLNRNGGYEKDSYLV